ncbi:MAG TPA: molybdenum cofactor guanylyltransferase [Chthonomonadaceae bacterium]|nr:molybdenum cofactor guanylyltransferase [Chthonomonadaceae bacterium]
MAMDAQGAIILAGGKSSRMGQDKALLPYNGTTLLEHVAASLQPVVKEVVVVTDVPDKYRLSCGRVLGDTYPGVGPVGGIVTGLTALGEGNHIVVACDMPGLEAGVLRLLLRACTPDWDAVVPEVGGQMEPLCAVYRHAAAPRLLRFLESGGRSAREALDSLRVKRVGEGVLRRIDPDLLCFANVNTPQELAEFRRQAALRPRIE